MVMFMIKFLFYTEYGHSFNVSCDVINFTPVPIDEMWSVVKKHYEDHGVWRKDGVIE